jgi:hypothetical protein
MKKNNVKNNKNKNKVPERKNLAVVNQGDLVIIRNRTMIAGALVGVIMLGLCVAGVFTLRSAWDLTMFWLLFGALIAGALYSLAKAIFCKVVLNSPKMTITVYNPVPKTYKFEDVNYVDLTTEKGTEGGIAYVVTIYIGVGKRTVKLVSYSKEQAQELAILLRGMLDNGAMVYPEGDEESFERSEEKKDEYTFITRKNKDASETKKEPLAAVTSDGSTNEKENDKQ